MATRKKMTSKKKGTKKKGTRGTGKAVKARNQEEQGIDNAEVIGAIIDHCSLIATKSSARKKINADISGSRNNLVARGLNRAALNVVEKCAKMEPQHAEGFARTLILGLKAIEQPLTPDLFDEPEKVEAKPEAVPDDQVPAAGAMH